MNVIAGGPHDGNPRISRWQYRVATLSVLLAALGYLAVGMYSGWHNLVRAVRDIGTAGICIALLLSLVNYGLRFVRWQMYLGAMGRRIPVLPSLRIYLAGFALTITPGKVGEIMRAALLVDWGVSFKKSVAALFCERLSDLLAIVLLALLGFAVLPGGRTLIVIGVAGLVSGSLVLSNPRLLGWLRRQIHGVGAISRGCRHLLEMLTEASRCNTPNLLAVATGISVVAWGAEALALYVLLDRTGESVPLVLAMSVYATAMLAGALSFLPGGLGGTEAVMVALLIWQGLDPVAAVAVTLIIRLTTLWFAVAIGGIVVAGYTLRSR